MVFWRLREYFLPSLANRPPSLQALKTSKESLTWSFGFFVKGSATVDGQKLALPSRSLKSLKPGYLQYTVIILIWEKSSSLRYDGYVMFFIQGSYIGFLQCFQRVSGLGFKQMRRACRAADRYCGHFRHRDCAKSPTRSLALICVELKGVRVPQIRVNTEGHCQATETPVPLSSKISTLQRRSFSQAYAPAHPPPTHHPPTNT